MSKLLDVPATSLLLAKLNPHSGKWAVLELETAEAGKKPKTKFHVKDGGAHRGSQGSPNTSV